MGRIKQGPQIHERYTMIANDLFTRTDISLKAKAIYGWLRMHREGWEITTKRTALALDVSESTVKRAIKELENAGYVERDRSRCEDGKFSSVDYVVLAEPRVIYDLREEDTAGHIWPLDVTSENSANARVETSGQKPTRGVLTHYNKTNSFKKDQEDKKDYVPTPKSGEGASDLHARFEAWYRAYPRKVGKQKAFLSWKKALKLVDEAELMEKTQAFADHHRRVGTEKAFIPHPTTWLNRGGWDDELDARPVRGQSPAPSFMAVLDEMNRTAIPDDFIDGFVVGELE